MPFRFIKCFLFILSFSIISYEVKPCSKELHLFLTTQNDYKDATQGILQSIFKNFQGVEAFSPDQISDLRHYITSLDLGGSNNSNLKIQNEINRYLDEFLELKSDLRVRTKRAEIFFDPSINKFQVRALEKGKAQVLFAKPITEDHFLVRLSKPYGFEIKAGEAALFKINDQERILSISNSPNDDYLEFVVRNSDSEFKKLYVALTKGEKVKIESLTSGLDFDPSKPSVFIAAGVGITPIRSILLDDSLEKPRHLIFANRTEIPFKDELDQLQASNPNMSAEYILSRPTKDWVGKTGRIDKPFLKSHLNQFDSESIFYIVAPNRMIEDIQGYLSQLGIDKNQIRTESFGGEPEKLSYQERLERQSASQEVKEDKPTKHDPIACYCAKTRESAIIKAISDGASNIEEAAEAIAKPGEIKMSQACKSCKSRIQADFF